MKHYRLILIPVVFVSLIFTSCLPALLVSSSKIGSSTVHSTRAGTFMPNDIQLHLTMDDFQYLGTQEVSASFKKYLGFITIFNEINSQEVAKRTVNIVNLFGNSNLPVKMDGTMMRALHVALVNVPDADFVVPVSIVTEKQQMFLGSVVTKKLKVKMYKVKEK